MKFGLFYLPTYLPGLRDAQTHYRGIIEQVEFADRVGIDYVWLVEHHFVRHGGLFPANYAFLSYLAARTRRIRLGTGATVLPLNDPVRVAEQAATLDQLSQGRFDFGVGRGFIRDEFDAFGVDMKDSRERVEEGVELVKQAWAAPTLEFKSKFRPPMSGLPILPPIYQKPHPPIWVACLLSPESFEWTAQEGYNLLYVAYHVDHPIAVERIGWYREALRKHGRRTEDHDICCVYHAHFLGEDDNGQAARGRAQADERIRRRRARSRAQAARSDRLQGLRAARRRSAQVRLRIVLSRTRADGRAEAGDRAHPRAGRRRHHPDRHAGRLRLIAAVGDHALAGDFRERRAAAGAGFVTC